MSDVLPRTITRPMLFDNGCANGMSHRWQGGQYCSIMTKIGIVGCGNICGAYLKAAPGFQALRIKAAETDRSISELVNEAVKLSLAEDAEDLAAFEERAAESSLPFESVVKDLKRRGKI